MTNSKRLQAKIKFLYSKIALVYNNRINYVSQESQNHNNVEKKCPRELCYYLEF